MMHACYLAVGKDKTAKQVRQSGNRHDLYLLSEAAKYMPLANTSRKPEQKIQLSSLRLLITFTEHALGEECSGQKNTTKSLVSSENRSRTEQFTS